MFVKILSGTHRGAEVAGIFPLVKEFNGKHITVKTNAQAPFAVENARVIVAEAGFEYCDSDGGDVDLALVGMNPGKPAEAEPNYELEFLSNETEHEAMDRIQGTFDTLNEMADASARGIIRGAIVSGPPGIGKSHGVEKTLEEANLTRIIKGREPDYEVMKGTCTPIGLYQTLYLNRKKGQVVLVDDCDDILYDQTSLNLLKAALDSGKKRRLMWRAESRILENADVPDVFDYEGSVMFLTNINFDTSGRKDSKLAMHLSALKSRCHYLDLGISNQRDQLLRIKQIVRDGMLDDYGFENGEAQMIVDFIFENADYMQELSLRMVGKIADIVAMKGRDNWMGFAESTCLKREAKFKRLRNEQKVRHHEA